MTPFGNTNTELESIKLFHKLFENGKILFEKLCSDSWEKSPLYFIRHPKPEQLYEEALRIYNNLKGFTNRRKTNVESKPPKFVDFLVRDSNKDEGKPHEEFVEIFGLCLWDIFSDNHDVVALDGKIYDIGSFRGAAGFIADYINTHIEKIESKYNYVDFYLGTAYISNRADLTPVYENIFRGLKAAGCNWVYSFPKIGIVDLSDLRESLDSKNQDDFLNYDPEKSFLEELETKEQKEKINELKEAFEKDYQDAVEKAKFEPFPKTVQAYKNVYKQLPNGWPHK